MRVFGQSVHIVPRTPDRILETRPAPGQPCGRRSI